MDSHTQSGAPQSKQHTVGKHYKISKSSIFPKLLHIITQISNYYCNYYIITKVQIITFLTKNVINYYHLATLIYLYELRFENIQTSRPVPRRKLIKR